jgi:hypothetical protein
MPHLWAVTSGYAPILAYKAPSPLPVYAGFPRLVPMNIFPERAKTPSAGCMRRDRVAWTISDR